MRRLRFVLTIGLLLALALAGSAAADPRADAIPTHATAMPQQEPFQPFVDIVPNLDGTELLVNARGALQIGEVYTASLGGSSHKGSYTMTYSETAALHQVTVPGFAPTAYFTATIAITTNTGLASPALSFHRELIPADTIQGQAVVTSTDELLALSFPNQGTLLEDTYVVTVGGPTPPGPLPAGWRLAGPVYAVRAPATVPAAQKPMDLEICYLPGQPGGATPDQLKIAMWTGAGWELLDGASWPERRCHSAGVTRFTSYALVAPAAAPPRTLVYLPLIHHAPPTPDR